MPSCAIAVSRDIALSSARLVSRWNRRGRTGSAEGIRSRYRARPAAGTVGGVRHRPRARGSDAAEMRLAVPWGDVAAGAGVTAAAAVTDAEVALAVFAPGRGRNRLARGDRARGTGELLGLGTHGGPPDRPR